LGEEKRIAYLHLSNFTRIFLEQIEVAIALKKNPTIREAEIKRIKTEATYSPNLQLEKICLSLDLEEGDR
jgi:hypothetical protein